MPRFLSICSGIEAASIAFQPLGWEAVALAEIEPFPCEVLAHHYPAVPNLGDLTRFRDWDHALLAQADVLCGGTPCQAFSVAGLRGSLDDERGNLTLTFCHLYDHLDEIRHSHGRPPAVCLWENVPGVLNTPDNAFGHFLAGLAGEGEALRPPGARWTDAGYVRGPRRALAWRLLDAQYFGLAQRRERVFVVASADPAFDPAAVLFEFEGLRRDTPPRRGPGEGTARGFETGPSGGEFTNLAPTLDTRCKDGPIRNQLGLGVAEPVAGAVPEGPHPTANIRAGSGGSSRSYIAAQEPLPFDTTQITSKANRSHPKAGDPCHPVAAGAHPPSIAFAIQERAVCENPSAGPDGVGVRKDDCAYTLEARQVPQAVAFTLHGQREGTQEIASPTDTAGTIREGTGSAIQNSSNTVAVSQSPHLPVSSSWRVRRLTPEECEILQGFPVGYTLIPGASTKKRKGDDLATTIAYLESLGLPSAEAARLAHSPDGPRYKALGNSWAVPCARWIGRRIHSMLTNPRSPFSHASL